MSKRLTSGGGIKVKSARSATAGAALPPPIPAPVAAPGASGAGPNKGRGVTGTGAVRGCGGRATRPEPPRSGRASEPERGPSQIGDSGPPRYRGPSAPTDLMPRTCSELPGSISGEGAGVEAAACWVGLSGAAAAPKTGGLAAPSTPSTPSTPDGMTPA